VPKPDFRAAASRRLSQDERLSDGVRNLLAPEGAAHDRSVRQLAVDRIAPNPKQPRVNPDAAALDELVASIREHGVLQPILVRPRERGQYEIVAGERRWRAVIAVGLALIPAIVEEMNDEEAIEVAVIENLQREDLSPLDEAAIFARMTGELGYSIRKLAEKIGKDKGYVENRLRLTSAPQDVRDLVASRSDTISHAYELMKVDDPARRAELAAQVARGELSLARLKAAIRGEADPESSLSSSAPTQQPAAAMSPNPANLDRETIAPPFFRAPAPAAPRVLPHSDSIFDTPAAQAPAPQPTPAPTPTPTQEQPIVGYAVAPSAERDQLLKANARERTLGAARESLGAAIDAMATLLASDEARASLNDLDRANMAKWLQIARIKLDNLAALMRQGR
jgi:ParB family chromosome partitioning protein